MTSPSRGAPCATRASDCTPAGRRPLGRRARRYDARGFPARAAQLLPLPRRPDRPSSVAAAGSARSSGTWADQRPLVGNGPFVLAEHDDSHSYSAPTRTGRAAAGTSARSTSELFGTSPTLTPSGAVAVMTPFAVRLRVRRTASLSRRHDCPERPGAGDSLPRLPVRPRPARRRHRPQGAGARRSTERALHWLQAGDPAGRGGFIPPTMPGHSHRVDAGL